MRSERRDTVSSQLGIEGDRNTRLINFCRYFQATRYISGDAARDYLDVGQFAAAGIEVVWHAYQHPQYTQLHGDFIPYLSALDLLLNMGPAANQLVREIAVVFSFCLMPCRCITNAIAPGISMTIDTALKAKNMLA